MPVSWGLSRTSSGALDIAIRAPNGEPNSQISLGRQVNSASQLIVGSTPSRLAGGIALTSDGCVCITTTEPSTKKYSSGIVTDTSGRVWATESPTGSLVSVYDPLLEFVLVDQRGALYVDGLPPSAADILALAPVAWYRLNTGITSAGGLVSAWADQSGNGADFTQGTGANQPTLTSRGSVLCDGVDNYMQATFNLPQPYTIYGLLNTVTWTNGDRILNGDDAGNDSFIRQSTGTPQIFFAAGANIGPVSPVLNTVNVISVVGNGASSLIQLNNDAPVTGNAGTRAFNNPTLAADNLPGSYAHTDNYEWIFFGTADNSAARAIVYAYLSFVGA